MDISLKNRIWRIISNNNHKVNAIKATQDILELPDIKKALSLLEFYNKGLLVKLAGKQEVPINPCRNSSDKFVCQTAQANMIAVGFKRVETIEV